MFLLLLHSCMHYQNKSACASQPWKSIKDVIFQSDYIYTRILLQPLFDWMGSKHNDLFEEAIKDIGLNKSQLKVFFKLQKT